MKNFQLRHDLHHQMHRGYQNLKITDFELGDRSRVVRWASYLVGMQYP